MQTFRVGGPSIAEATANKKFKRFRNPNSCSVESGDGLEKQKTIELKKFRNKKL